MRTSRSLLALPCCLIFLVLLLLYTLKPQAARGGAR